MTEQEWLASDDPGAMLSFLTGDGKAVVARKIAGACEQPTSDRKLLLFACEAAILDVGGGEGHWHSLHIRQVQAWADGGMFPPCHNIAGADGMYELVSGSGLTAARFWASEGPFSDLRKDRAALLRDIVGNPWRPVPGDCDVRCQGGRDAPGDTVICRAHRLRFIVPDPCPKGRAALGRRFTPTVLSIAYLAYDERRVDPRRVPALPVLHGEGPQRPRHAVRVVQPAHPARHALRARGSLRGGARPLHAGVQRDR